MKRLGIGQRSAQRQINRPRARNIKSNGYLARIAESSPAREQALLPKPRAWGWPVEIAVPWEQGQMSRPVRVGDSEDLPIHSTRAKPTEDNRSVSFDSVRILPELQARVFRREKLAEVQESLDRPSPVIVNASAELPGERKADKSAGDVQNRTGRPLEKPQTNVLAQPRENALGKSQSTERRGKDEEDGVVMPGQAQGRREAVLQSVVEERVIEANAARDAQQPEAKQSDNYEKLIRNRDETKIQGTRVSIGTIEVRTVVRQAAPPVVTAPQAQIQGGSHNRGERTGPLTRSLGWRFGLVQG